MAARAVVTGDKEIIANIRRAYRSVGGTAMDVSLRTGLEPMREETVDNARQHRQPHTPKGGHLDEGIVTARREVNGFFGRVYWIAFARRARKLAHLVEFGTAPHWQPKRGIMHPGARAFPFFRPAFESTKHLVVSIISNRVWEQISSSIVGSFRK